MKTILFCSLMSLAFTPVCVSAQDADAKETTRLFIKAIYGQDADAALKCVYVPSGGSAKARAEIEGILRRSKTAPSKPVAVISKEIGTVALVIMKDAVPTDRGKPDYDTITFLKRDGGWRMVIKSLIKTTPEEHMTAEERANLAELMEWEQAKRAELER